MTLSIFSPGGTLVLTTTDMLCVPSNRKLFQLADAGYYFNVDGVDVPKTAVRNACRDSQNADLMMEMPPAESVEELTLEAKLILNCIG